MSFSDSVGWANSFIVCPPFTAQKVGKKSVAHPTMPTVHALCGTGFETPSLMFYQTYKYSKRYGTGYKPVLAVGVVDSAKD